MKTYLLLLSLALSLSACDLSDHYAVPADPSLATDQAHFDIYIELLPDSSLNIDEQSHQKYRLRLMSRGGYQITMYKLSNPPYGEFVIRYGLSNTVGNYKALDMPLGTYHIVVEDAAGTLQETLITPAPGKLTMLTFGFIIRG